MTELPGLQAARTAFREGRVEEGRTLLEAAANSGAPDAQYSFAVALAYGQGGRIDRVEAMRRLDAARQHIPAARELYRFGLAHAWNAKSGWKDAVADLIDAAAKGDPVAMRDAGLLCQMLDNELGAAELLEQAALKDDALAGMALLRLGKARTPDASWVSAVRGGLIRSKHPLAGELAEKPLEPAKSENYPADWSEISDQISQFEFKAPAGEPLIAEISAVSHDRALPLAVCDFLISTGLRALQPSTIVDPVTGQKTQDPHRQSLSMTFAPHLQGLVHVAVERTMSQLAGCAASHCERLNLLFYRPGEQYRPHVDYFAPDDSGTAEELSRSGQRLATSLVCLHAADSGGGTRFPRFDTVWRGLTGDGLTFRNVKSNCEVEPLTLHAGEPVLTGWKALASLWIRDRRFDR